MPSYEIFYIIRKMSRRNLVQCCKRLGEDILNNDGIIRKIEYLGTKTLPYRMRNSSKLPTRHTEGNFFVYHIDVKPDIAKKLHDQYPMDSELVRGSVIEKTQKVEDDYKCTLEEEMLPPSYRKSVQSVMNVPKKLNAPRWYTPPEKQDLEL